MKRHVLFLIGSARKHGNAEQLARLAAQSLPAQVEQTWLHLRDYPLPPFEDLRHTTGVYPTPAGPELELLNATLHATDLVFVCPVYWYSVPTDTKRYLDQWSAWLRLPDVPFKALMGSKRYWVVAASTGTPAQAEPMLGTLRLCAAYFGTDLTGTLLGNGSKPGEALNNPETVQAARQLFQPSTLADSAATL